MTRPIPRLLVACLLLTSVAAAQSTPRFLGSALLDDRGPAAPDAPLVIVEAEDGGSFVIASTTVTGPGTESRGFAVRRIAANGEEIWRRAVPAIDASDPLASEFGVSAACTDREGGLVAVGYIEGGDLAPPALGGSDGWAVRISGAGQVLWSKRFGGTGGDAILAAASAPSGMPAGVILGGSTSSDGFGGLSADDPVAFLARIDGAGNLRWTTRAAVPDRSSSFSDVGVGAGGDAFAVGHTTESPAFPLDPPIQRQLTARFGSDGRLVWTLEDPEAEPGIQAIAADHGGGFLLCGWRLSPAFGIDGFLQRRDASGALLWEVVVEPFLRGSNVCNDIVVLDDGSIAVVGHALKEHMGALLDHAALTIHSDQGDLLEVRVFPPSGPLTLSSYWRIALDGSGGVSVLGADVVPGSQVPGAESRPLVARYATRTFGTTTCAGRPNSTGGPGRLFAEGNHDRSLNRLTLWTEGLPANTVGLALASTTAGFTANPGGSQGDLCLAGAIGRFDRPGELGATLSGDGFHLDVDLDDVPSPTGPVSVMAGVTWHFQVWYRDPQPAGPSNFTDAIEVVFM